MTAQRGQETCPTCGKVTWLVTHSCPGLMPDTSPTPVDLDAIEARMNAADAVHFDNPRVVEILADSADDVPVLLAELHRLRASIGPDSERIRELEAARDEAVADAIHVARRTHILRIRELEAEVERLRGVALHWRGEALAPGKLLPGPDDEATMIAKLREAGYLVIRPKFPPEPRKIDDPAVLARRIGLRVAGPDEIVVSREDVAYVLNYGSPSNSEVSRPWWSARGRLLVALRAALSQPQPEEAP